LKIDAIAATYCIRFVFGARGRDAIGSKFSSATFKSFVKGIHNEFETAIKRVRSDNGSEFKNTRIDELYDEFGIRH